MLKPLLLTLTLFLIALATLMACTEATPAPGPTETPVPSPIAATPALIPNTPEPEPTATTVPATTEAPTPVPPETPSPFPTMDRETVLPSLSEDELACIGGDPEMMIAALTGNRPVSREERARLTECLEDDTVGQRFMTAIIPVPLSRETSDCVLAALEVIYPNAVMTTGLLEGDPKTAFAGSMAALSVYVACLNDEEWAAAAPRLGMQPEERDAMMCIMASLGGPAEMATAMAEAVMAEEVGEDTPLFDASLECGMEPRPEPTATPGLETATPTPMPMATTAAPRPTSAPPTPAPGATRAAATPAQEPTKADGNTRSRSRTGQQQHRQRTHWSSPSSEVPDEHPRVQPGRVAALDRRERGLPRRPAGSPDRRELSNQVTVRGRPGVPGRVGQVVGAAPGTSPRKPPAHRRRPPRAAEERPPVRRMGLGRGEERGIRQLPGGRESPESPSPPGTTGAKAPGDPRSGRRRTMTCGVITPWTGRR